MRCFILFRNSCYIDEVGEELCVETDAWQVILRGGGARDSGRCKRLVWAGTGWYNTSFLLMHFSIV